MSTPLAAALGGAAGGVALVGIAAILIWYCLFRQRNSSRTSESNSSEPSLQVEGGTELALRGGVSYPLELQGARRLTLEELNAATKNFGSINLIGSGMFGEVYKGLLQDGMVVAIKRRPSIPSQQFIQEVLHLSSIHHRNLVSLLGYCQENDLQMLVYEYIPNGSVSAHLYGASQVSSGKLEFKHRLSIAHGTAKGDHLQNHRPSVVMVVILVLVFFLSDIEMAPLRFRSMFYLFILLGINFYYPFRLGAFWHGYSFCKSAKLFEETLITCLLYFFFFNCLSLQWKQKFQIGVSPFAARLASLLQQKAPNILLKSVRYHLFKNTEKFVEARLIKWALDFISTPSGVHES